MKDYDVITNQIITEDEAVKQSLLIRLLTVQEEFIHDPELGSRLRELHHTKPSHRDNLAKAFVYEALDPEQEVIINDVTTKEFRTDIYILIDYEWEGRRGELEVPILNE